MDPVSIRDEPARRLLGLPHAGPYPQVGPVFRRVWQTLCAAGLGPRTQGGAMVAFDDPDTTPAGERPGRAPVHAIYRNDPSDTPPEALRTDLLAPLA